MLTHYTRSQNDADSSSDEALIFFFFPIYLFISFALWSEFLASDPEVRIRFPELPDFLRSSGSGTGSTLPREYN
jgi:hypothetical protein